jgi:ribonuclease HI
MHLFFLCPFSKAAWFSYPWYIRTEVIASNHRSVPNFIQALLTSGHPSASLEYIFTFLWCLWKARNDQLFCRKAHKPYQVFVATQAILQGAKLGDQAQNNQTQALVQKREIPKRASPIQEQNSFMDAATSQNLQNNLQVIPTPGTTVADPWSIPGTKIFTDAAWTQQHNHDSPPSRAGLGIIIQLEGAHQCTRLLISAVSPPAISALQAEVFGLLLAANLVHHLQLQQVTFFTDCAILAKAAASRNIIEDPGHWQIRPQLATLFSRPSFRKQKIFHIPRCMNFKAHFQAKLATRIQDKPFSIRCISTQESAPCTFKDVISHFSDALCTLTSVKCC